MMGRKSDNRVVPMKPSNVGGGKTVVSKGRFVCHMPYI